MKDPIAMRHGRIIAGSLFAALVAVGGVALPAAGQGDSFAMLSALTKGEWEVRERGGATNHICVRTGRELVQLRHKRAGCKRFVVEEGPKTITVQYSCNGNGYGRTSIRRETSELVQIDSQGLSGKVPFEFSAEARRIGPCR